MCKNSSKFSYITIVLSTRAPRNFLLIQLQNFVVKQRGEEILKRLLARKPKTPHPVDRDGLEVIESDSNNNTDSSCTQVCVSGFIVVEFAHLLCTHCAPVEESWALCDISTSVYCSIASFLSLFLSF